MNFFGILLIIGAVILVGYLGYGLYKDIRERKNNKGGSK